ncbi:hypothetical protein Pst134EA_027099 [Puccinia striiformis f. sp. tritici]|uniref:hypothetical protein n=1 Tax=Puccinia striiformis f. sp. tritici TaxID=168172 RepID=UPI0020078AA1|nr:hypothetical protein Pst134EA_027099 [Puccinia striiformis f. sp. tritici]KAH9450396.1 hypothetical protein Pst134EA_027099 [Puccinia striiformis f. sp. tritici]
MCPLYDKMHNLLGQKPNVNPLCRADAEDTEDLSESSNEESSEHSSDDPLNKSSGHSENSHRRAHTSAIHPSLMAPQQKIFTQNGGGSDVEIVDASEVQIDHPDRYDEEQIDREGERFMDNLLGNSSARLPSSEDLLTRPSKSPQKQGAELWEEDGTVTLERNKTYDRATLGIRQPSNRVPTKNASSHPNQLLMLPISKKIFHPTMRNQTMPLHLQRRQPPRRRQNEDQSPPKV